MSMANPFGPEVSHFREMAAASGTDKTTNHRYEMLYPLLFESFRDLPFHLVEVGVYGGASLRLWEQYFPRARIWGLDNDPVCATKASDRSTVIIGDQGDRATIEALLEAADPVSIWIDDGSHTWKHQVDNFRWVFPKLPAGALYAIEDLEFSTETNRAGGGDITGAAMVAGEVHKLLVGRKQSITFNFYATTNLAVFHKLG